VTAAGQRPATGEGASHEEAKAQEGKVERGAIKRDSLIAIDSHEDEDPEDEKDAATVS